MCGPWLNVGPNGTHNTMEPFNSGFFSSRLNRLLLRGFPLIRGFYLVKNPLVKPSLSIVEGFSTIEGFQCSPTPIPIRGPKMVHIEPAKFAKFT